MAWRSSGMNYNILKGIDDSMMLPCNVSCHCCVELQYDKIWVDISSFPCHYILVAQLMLNVSL